MNGMELIDSLDFESAVNSRSLCWTGIPSAWGKELRSKSVPSKPPVLSPSLATIRAVAGECVAERSEVLGEIGGDCVEEIESRDESETWDELLVLG